MVQVPVAEEPAPKSVEALISSVASEVGVSSTTLYNLAYSESRLNPDPPGSNDGHSACGVVQVHAKEWNMDCDELKENPEIGLRFAAEHIKKGDAWKYWTPLNCYTYLTHLVPNLPKMAQIQPNTSVPHKGQVAIFYYKDKNTGESVKHVALIVSEPSGGTFTVKEANFEAGVIGTRTIHTGDSHLIGFYDPTV